MILFAGLSFAGACDPDAAELALVPDVKPDQQGRDLLDDTGPLKRKAVDNPDTGDLLDQGRHISLCVLIIAADQAVAVDRLVEQHEP